MSHIRNINYSNIAPSFQDKISNLISFLCLSLLKRLDTKQSNTKYRRLSWKQLSHVRIMSKYWCIERGLLQRKLRPSNKIVLEVRVGTHWGRKWCFFSGFLFVLLQGLVPWSVRKWKKSNFEENKSLRCVHPFVRPLTTHLIFPQPSISCV